jgi:hypothetical protein
MLTSEYERKYETELPDAMDDMGTVGTRPDPEFDSSPDVSVDGSIQRDHDEGRDSDNNEIHTRLSRRQILLLITVIILGIGGLLLQSGVISL